jgi:hypothetical protein
LANRASDGIRRDGRASTARSRRFARRTLACFAFANWRT